MLVLVVVVKETNRRRGTNERSATTRANDQTTAGVWRKGWKWMPFAQPNSRPWRSCDICKLDADRPLYHTGKCVIM